MGRSVEPEADDDLLETGSVGESNRPAGSDVAASEDFGDLTCPACGADLTADARFIDFRVCGSCHRHFSIQARDRIGLTVDPASLHELGAASDARMFEKQVPAADSASEHQDFRVIGDAVVTGTARIGGVETVIVSLDDHLVGPSIGALMAEKIMVAFELAHTQRCPVIIMCAGGAARTQPGPLTVVQSGRLAAAAARLHMDGIPMIAVLTHPTSGWIFRALASQRDLIFAEPGSRIGIGPHSAGDLPGAQSRTVEGLLADGWVDEIVDRSALRDKLSTLLNLLAFRGFARGGSRLPASDTAGPASWQALAQLRNPERPDGAFYLSSLVSSFMPLNGDRVEGDDPGTVCGLGRFDSVTIAVAVLNHPCAAGAERSEAIAARKIMRLAKLAGRLELSLLVLVDGGYPSPAMNTTIESAQAVASLSGMLALLPVPVIAVAIGEVSGSLATSLMSVDRQFMEENAVLTSGSPESWRPSRRSSPVQDPSDLADRGSVLTARECLRLGLVDGVIAEPGDGAHGDPQGAVAAVRAAVQQAMAELAGTGQRRLLDTRHKRQRMLGQSTPEGLAAARSELWDLQEWQHSLTKSIDEWRGRWEQRRGASPKLALHRPDLGDLADRFRARRSEILERAGRGDRSGA